MSAIGNADPHFTSVKGAAQRLGMSIDEVYDLVKTGEIKHVQRTPGAKIYVLIADLDRWVGEAAAARTEVAS